MGIQPHLPDLSWIWIRSRRMQHLYCLSCRHCLRWIWNWRQHSHRYNHLPRVHSTKPTILAGTPIDLSTDRRCGDKRHRVWIYTEILVHPKLQREKPPAIMPHCRTGREMLLEGKQHGLALSDVHSRCNHLGRFHSAIRRFQFPGESKVLGLSWTRRQGH